MSNPREPICIVAVGFKGVGKTYTTKKEVESYVISDSATGQKGRPVLAFDVNGEYTDYKAVDFDITEENEHVRGAEIRKITVPGKYRVVAYKKNRALMSAGEMYLTVVTIANNFRNGLLILEDINRYMLWNVKIDMVSLLIGLRHYGVDLIIHFQSMRAIPTRIWANLNMIRLHKQSDSIEKYKGKIDNYELFKLAEIIVDREYISDERYLLWIDNLSNKLINVNQETFSYACKQYLAMNNREVNTRMNQLGDDGETRKHSSRGEVINHFIQDKWQQYVVGHSQY